MTVHAYLATAPVDLKMDLWAASAAYANWIEGRENGDRETWQVMVYDEQSTAFLAAAEQLGVTVEEIVGSGDAETYQLRVGEQGTGWQAHAGG